MMNINNKIICELRDIYKYPIGNGFIDNKIAITYNTIFRVTGMIGCVTSSDYRLIAHNTR